MRLALLAGVLSSLAVAPGASAAGPAGPRLAVIKETWKPRRVTLLTVDPNGRAPMRIAGGQEWDGPVEAWGQLSWRPDGAQLAYPTINSIFLARIDGSGARELNIARAERPVFAPDGNTLAFTRYADGGAATWTIDLVSGAQHQLTPTRRGLVIVGSSFSADGNALLATRIDNKRKGRAEVVAVNLDTGGMTGLLGNGFAPIYSPDSSRIAFLREAGKLQVIREEGQRWRTADLFVLGLANHSVRRLTRTPHKDEAFASWDPSGERIAFERFRGGHFEWANSVVQINADGSCEDEVLARKRTVFVGTGWQPGPGREAGRIDC
jgi:Tol biopolymer transport system component